MRNHRIRNHRIRKNGKYIKMGIKYQIIMRLTYQERIDVLMKRL